MTFVWPPLLAALLLIPLGLLAARAIDARRRRRVRALGGLGSAVGAARTRTGWRHRVAPALFVVALAILSVALARPEAVVSVPRSEGTLILTFDVSGSMAATDVEPFAEDVEPTRMEVAKAVARTFVEERPPGVVIGLVAFSDAGLAVQVPTDDTAAVTRAIERLEPQLGTSLGQGILAALDTIIKAESDTPPEYYSDRAAAPTTAPAPVEPGSHSSAAMLVLSDGENNESPDPIEAAQAAAERGIRIHTVGVGSTAGTTLDLDGFTVHSQLQEDTLRAIAEVTDGTYRHAHDATGLTAVYGALARPVVAREEHIEVTALLAGAGVLLLVAGGVASLLVSGRLP